MTNKLVIEMALLHLTNLVTNEKLATQTWISTRGENQRGELGLRSDHPKT